MIDFIKWIQKEPEKIGFEDIKQAIRQGSQHHLLINTMTIDEQECLISATLPYDKEEIVINKILEQSATTQSIYIIVYGKNSVDDSAKTKAIQLRTLGFKNVFIYSGGLFEWLLLQDIYGTAEFPTTSITKDLLKYRPHPSVFSQSIKSLTY